MRLTAGVPKPVWLLGWVSLCTDAATEMIYPLLPLFLARVLGAGALSLGIIEGAAEAANSALKVLSGRWSDRLGVHRPLVIAGYGISSAARPLIAIASSWVHVLVLRFVDRTGKGIRTSPRDAMLAGYATEMTRGRVYGLHRAMDHAGAVVGPLVASAFLLFRPGDYRTLFALTIVPGVIAMLLLLFFVKEDTRSRSLAQPGFGGENESLRVRNGAAALSSPLKRTILVILIFSLGNSADAFLLLRLGDIGVPIVWIPLLWSLLHVVKATSSVIGGAMSDRWGRRTLIGAGWVVYAAVYLGFAATDSVAPAVSLFLAYGLYFGFSEGAEKALIADLANPEVRGTAFGLYNAALGVGALAASVLFGLIWTRVAPAAAFGFGAALALTAVALLFAVVPEPERRVILSDSHDANSGYQ